MQEIPACVEFFGLPGAGKSTLSKRVAEIMSRAGIAVDQPMYVLAHQAPRYKRIAIKSFYVLKGLCLHPDYTIRSAKAILRTKQNSIADLVLVLFNWLFVSSFIRHPRSREAVRLLDRGLFQALWSVGFSARQPESLANMFSELAPVLPLPDIVIVVEVEPPIAAQRMSTRVCHDSRVKQAPPHAASSLTRAQVTVAEVKAILRIIAAGRWAMVTLEVENKQPDDLDCNAQRIARTIRVSSNMV
jgi:thymidylate kinase